MSTRHNEHGPCACPACSGHVQVGTPDTSSSDRVPQMAPTYDNNQVIGQIVSGAKWSTSTITFGFLKSSPSWDIGYEGDGFSQFTSAQKAATRNVMSQWDDVIAPSFVEQTSNEQYANVKFGNTTTSINYAHAYYPGNYNWAGEVWLNAATYTGLYQPDPGDYYYMTILHEVGHAIGLSHPGNYNGGAPTYASDAVYAQDTHQWTVMSYFSASNTGADWNGGSGWQYAQTPMVHDILAAQAIYGADTTTRTGNTTYGFNSNAGQAVFDFSQNAAPVLTIYDAGGTDTLDLSGFSQRAIIDLEPGTYSSAGGTTSAMTFNIGIAHNTWIENAIGGSGNDTIRGNVLDNTLSGNGGNDHLHGLDGNDTLSGGAGTDWAYFTQAIANYTFQVLESSIQVVADFVDTVMNDIEWFSFSDTNISYADLEAQYAFTEYTNLADSIVLPVSGDSVRMLGGDDQVSYTGGYATIDGGSGTDTVDFSGFGAAVWVDLGFSGTSEGWTRDDTHVRSGTWREIADLTDVENVTGSDYDDKLYGDDGANILAGGAGDDNLYGNGGNDTLDGGTGSDTAFFSNAFSTYNFAQSGTDILVTGSADGTDTVRDTVEYFKFSDETLSRAELISTLSPLTFTANADTVDLPSSGGTFDTLGGNDHVSYTGGYARIDGGLGTDTVDFSNFGSAVWVNLAYSGTSEGWTRDDTHVRSGTWREIADLTDVENVTGSDHDDKLYGDDGANVLAGGAGNDILQGNGGDDTLDGGAGSDTAYFSGALSTYDFAQSGTDILVTGSADGTDTVRDTVEYFKFSDDTLSRAELISTLSPLTFTANADTVVLPSCGGTFDTLGGNDHLSYTGGYARIDGGLGTDTVDFSNFGSAVWVNLAYSGTSEGWTRDATDLSAGTWREIADLTDVENITGSDYGDKLYGDDGANILTGGAGNDILQGNGGDDTLDGGAGSDTAYFSGALSTYGLGQNGTDVLITGSAEGTDTVRDTVEYFRFADGTLSRTELLSSLTAPPLTANDDTVVLPNTGGTVDTLGGDDHVSYTGGYARIDGGLGSDTVDFSSFNSAVWVNLAYPGASEGWTKDTVDLQSGTWREIADLIGVENVTGSEFDDKLYGDEGANILLGLGGDDILQGNGGSDILDGGSGQNTLTGGAGADVFRITALDIGDLLTDYSFGEGDTIDLSSLFQVDNDGSTATTADDSLDQFVRVVDNGSGNVDALQIDQDGGGDNFSLTVAVFDAGAAGDAVRIAFDDDGAAGTSNVTV